jgi:MarR family transcriptional regulator, 2-MHQ and catechol-resistance regulon repressor
LVDKLEKKGFVQRRACKEDRRLIYADLTEAGERMIEEVFPQHAEVIRQAMGGLDEEEKKAASRLLKKLGKYAEEGFR